METKEEIKLTKPGKMTKEDRDRALGRVLIQKANDIDMPGKSKAIQDPFDEMYGDGGNSDIIKPPLNLLELTALWENNTILGSCIDVMEVNCDGLGHRFVPYTREELVPENLRKQIEVEKTILENFFRYASVEKDELSFTDLRMLKRRDQELAGGSWWEVLRNNKGELMGFNVLPAHTCRFTKLSEEAIPTNQKLLLQNTDGSLSWQTRTVFKRFRKMVQVRSSKTAWFKMFGDPRIIDCRDGNVKEDLESQYQANECIYFPCVVSSRTPYGMPRYVGNLFSVYGSRSSEEINYFTFENNNIPSMAIMVSNGMLTEGTIDRIQDFVSSQIAGKKNYSQFLIMESEPIGEGVANPGTMKLDIKPLTDVQHKDELFQNYDQNNRKKLKGAYRIPPIYLGESDDYNKATAQVSKVLTDEQVFNPKRNTFDELMNRLILPELGIKYLRYKSNTPDTTDNETLVKMLTAAEKTGAMNPSIGRNVMNDIFSRDLGPVKSIDPDVPFSIQLANAMKNQSDPRASLSSSPGRDFESRTLGNAQKMLEIRKELQEIYKSENEEIMEDLYKLMPYEDEEE